MEISLRKFKYLMALSGKTYVKNINGGYMLIMAAVYILITLSTSFVEFTKVKVDLNSKVIRCGNTTQLVAMYRLFFKDNLSEYNSLLMVSLFEILDEGGVDISAGLYGTMIKDYVNMLKEIE